MRAQRNHVCLRCFPIQLSRNRLLDRVGSVLSATRSLHAHRLACAPASLFTSLRRDRVQPTATASYFNRLLLLFRAPPCGEGSQDCQTASLVSSSMFSNSTDADNGNHSGALLGKDRTAMCCSGMLPGLRILGAVRDVVNRVAQGTLITTGGWSLFPIRPLCFRAADRSA